jgi:hypothetical protein
MICNAAIASRSGLHSRCGLPDNHKGGCVPVELLSSANFQYAIRGAARDPAEWTEAEFVCHLLAVVESAGDTLTLSEALYVARGLLRARLGLERRT